MSSAFMSAMTTNDQQTENGMLTHSTSDSYMLDWFYSMGALRRATEDDILQRFKLALGQDERLAVRSLFYLRDIRKGMGERRAFRVCLKWLAQSRPEIVRQNLTNIVEFGRYNDLEVLLGTSVEGDAVEVWHRGLQVHETQALAAKWAPRKGPWFGLLRKRAQKTATGWRKFLAASSETVEQQMCARSWDKIDYEHVPSVASLMYRKAFAKHDNERYKQFLSAVEKGEAKINASVLYPHDIVSKIFDNNEEGKELEVLWKNLPDVFEGNFQSILPVCDVSGSMYGLPINVSIGLGMYLAERNQGAFHNVICTFTDQPKLVTLTGDLFTRVKQVNKDVGYNTNLHGVFETILSRAKSARLSDSDMPRMILLISDMQFDEATNHDGDAENALQMIKRQYTEAGYSIPAVVFWNVNARSGVPVKRHESGTALVSGFSPNIMKKLLQGALTPDQVMLDTLNDARYDVVKI